MASLMADKSEAREFRLRALKKANASSSALLTFKPVARRSCVLPIKVWVFWSDSRLDRVAVERVISLLIVRSSFSRTHVRYDISVGSTHSAHADSPNSGDELSSAFIEDS